MIKDLKSNHLGLPAITALNLAVRIKTRGSESRGQEEALCNERVSYLHVALLKTLQVL